MVISGQYDSASLRSTVLVVLTTIDGTHGIELGHDENHVWILGEYDRSVEQSCLNS